MAASQKIVFRDGDVNEIIIIPGQEGWYNIYPQKYVYLKIEPETKQISRRSIALNHSATAQINSSICKTKLGFLRKSCRRTLQTKQYVDIHQASSVDCAALLQKPRCLVKVAQAF